MPAFNGTPFAVPAAALREPARAGALAAKLQPPSRQSFEVPRTVVCDQIFDAAAARLILLRAPAGFGKTTAMQQVRQRFADSGVPTAWLTLDSADNDVGRFLSVLAAALDPLVPGLTALQGGGWSDLDGRALDLIDRVAAHPAPFTLFLDDFEALQSAAVLGLVNALIAQLPRGVQLVVGSRGVPELGLGWLRARGRLLEIDPTQLRLSADETGQMLRALHGDVLSADDIERLHRSTEGWAAAVWLASVSLQHRENPSDFIAGFSGSNTAVVDYLVEDVLARQPEDVRLFLLRTSILGQLDAAICDHLCSRDDSHTVLQRLERAHLFLVPVQGSGGAYRYHGMFADFLRGQLQRYHPDQVPALHHAACAWYLGEGRPVPAIGHALQTGALDQAIALLQAHAPQLLEQGRVRLLLRWMDPLVAQGALDGQPMLRAIHAWAVCFGRGGRHAWPLLEWLERAETCDPQIQAHRLVMRPLLLAVMDRFDEADPLGNAVLDRLPSNATFAFARSVLEIAMATFSMYSGRYHHALRLVDAVRKRQAPQEGRFSFILSDAVEGAVDLGQGRLRQALGRLRLAVRNGAASGARATNGNTMAAALLAESLYEAGRCEQAERLLSVNVPLIRRVGVPDQIITAHVVLARIVLSRGEGERALQVLAELEHIGYREQLPRAVASARLERVRILAVQGRIAAARAELARCGDSALWERVSRMAMRANDVETPDVAAARCAIAQGNGAEVVASLRTALDQAERVYRERRMLTLRLLLAQAHHQDGQHKKAMRVLAKAVRFAASEGYVRAFLDEGPGLMALLHELHQSPTVLLEETIDGGAQGPDEFIEALLRQSGRQVDPLAVRAGAQASSGAQPTAAEVLTGKETQVLRLAAQGLSNEQMAERLFVAETTVRTHLRNINVKLDVRNRMEAVQAARRQRLID
ncbi:LuxR C-terminal-related transcriptional regulator [Pseudorhodoferax sp. Leaf274]|uniref:LuxR C-terminal-related transcriptional regulator n=1 Tax=Pseudorhodoferax sp. Leaf274 TaxID=1736318 RepID=UPI000702A47C|nr:LuxR C-terminal-related transcriptional regulator [Pseudorhodoferax sp. Leaf274]KQP45492.1 hypothetical protein ASF44_25320 [Pseudorhodoferax sp. Leaf274]